MSSARERSGVAKPSQRLKVVVNGETVIIDPQTLTMRERQQVRGALAKVASEFGIEPDDNDALCGTVWIVLRRNDPSISFEDVAEALTLGAVADAELDEVDDSPEV